MSDDTELRNKTMQQPDRSWIIVVIILGIIVAGVAGITLLGYVVVDSLGIEGGAYSEEELAELEAQYGTAVEEVQGQIDAEVQRQREALTAARAAVPDDAIISPDWDFRECLMAAWLPVEEQTLDDLSVDLAGWWSGLGTLSEETLDGLSERFGGAQEAGNLTELEARFNPASHSLEEVLANFREYVLTARFLDEMEAAIDLEVCRHVRGLGEDEDEDFTGRRFTAVRLLACRAIFKQQQGDRAGAVETVGRVYRVVETVDEDPAIPRHECYHNLELRGAAHSALQCVLAEGPVEAEARARILALIDRETSSERFAERLRRCVVTARHDDYAFGDLKEPAASFCVYEAFALTEELIALLDRPFFEVEDEIDEASEQLMPEFLREIEEGEDPDVSFKDAVEMLKMSVRMMRSGDEVMDLAYYCEGLAGLCRVYARASLDGHILRVAFALADYREEHGAYPDDLDALAPEQLSEIPTDPATGKLVDYERIDEGYELTAPSMWGYDEEPDVLWKTPLQ